MYEFDDLDDSLPVERRADRMWGRFVFMQAISADAEALDDGPRLSDATHPPGFSQRSSAQRGDGE